jgi:hypothetical protein
MKDINKIKKVVAEQAEDYGLWGQAQYASEAYIQSELRRLHKVIEDEFGDARILEE